MPKEILSSDQKSFWGDQRRRNYFGFASRRACVSFLYARREGATQKEVDELVKSLHGTRYDRFNILRQAQAWGHIVFVWEDTSRGGRVYKLICNPDHMGPSKREDPLPNWEKLNEITAPPNVNVEEW